LAFCFSDLLQTTMRKRTKQSLPKTHSDGMIEFSAEPLKSIVTCSICEGLFRDPYTTISCRHTFCRSCLETSLHFNPSSSCPTCGSYLGKKLGKFSAADHVLQDLLDKLLFPTVATVDSQQERQFFLERGVGAKKLREEDILYSKGSAWTIDADVTLELVRQGSFDQDFKPLEDSIIRAAGSTRISQIKKYLHIQTGLLVSDLEVLCQGTMLGDELSLTFVSRTVWRKDDSPMLWLTYRRKS